MQYTLDSVSLPSKTIENKQIKRENKRENGIKKHVVVSFLSRWATKQGCYEEITEEHDTLLL